jgi:hypothetical protein
MIRIVTNLLDNSLEKMVQETYTSMDFDVQTLTLSLVVKLVDDTSQKFTIFLKYTPEIETLEVSFHTNHKQFYYPLNYLAISRLEIGEVVASYLAFHIKKEIQSYDIQVLHQ